MPVPKPNRTLVLLLALVVGLAGCASVIDGGARQPEQAAPVEPLSGELQVELARALNLARNGQYDAATDMLRSVQVARPDVGMIDARMGWVLQQQDRQYEARDAYRRALEKNPSEPMAANNLALMLQADGDFKGARKLFEAGLQADPDAPELHYNLAVLAELYLLDLPLALDHYRRYQTLTDNREKQVAGWIADLERRVN